MNLTPKILVAVISLGASIASAQIELSVDRIHSYSGFEGPHPVIPGISSYDGSGEVHMGTLSDEGIWSGPALSDPADLTQIVASTSGSTEYAEIVALGAVYDALSQSGSHYILAPANSSEPRADWSTYAPYFRHRKLWDEPITLFGSIFEIQPMWQPTGWLFVTWPYVYSSDEAKWRFFSSASTSSRWALDTTTGVWDELDQRSGWIFFSGDYFYDSTRGTWNFFSRNNTQWVNDLVTGSWKVLGD